MTSSNKPTKSKSSRSQPGSSEQIPPGYIELLEGLKARIKSSRIRAATAVNRELVGLYWQIGQEILERQNRGGWGAKIIDRLAADLRRSFPDMRGLSPRNLKYMRAFAGAYPDEQFVQEALAQITWYHNITLMTKVKNEDERKWYIQQTVLHGWSQPVMVHQIESGLFHRKGKALTNFPETLPQPKADLARELLKDPYTLDFLAMDTDLSERKLQQGLLENLRDFLIELGKGFAFVGSQYHLEVGGQDYYLDLLFYHLNLRAYVVIELKAKPFKPEFAGKMNFYLSVVDDQLRHPEDGPSIGLILCKERNRIVVDYALKASPQPMGVAEYKLTRSLPKDLKDSLPTPKELRSGLKKSDKID